jgi:3-oxoacyl-[acyl-carrier protein] reductase
MVNEKLQLRSKVVLITGSSIGIGRETAYKFAQEGCKVIITYHKDKAEAVAAEKKCKELGAPDTLLLKLDVTDNKSIKDAVKKAVGKFGHINILVNNAGVIAWKLLKDQDFDEIDAQISTNLAGLIKMTKECLPHVNDTIINVASGAGITGYAELAPYCATKFGVRGFTQSLAQELNGIKVFAVNPGTTSTRMTNFSGVPAEKVAEIILNTAKGKYGLESGSDVNVRERLR